MKDAVIVSSGDRGFYTAHMLQQQGISTTVLDVSAIMPPVLSTDNEGPFGVFIPSELNDLQKKYLCGDNEYLIPQGFCVLTSKGPIEFQGKLSSWFQKTKKDFKNCHSVLSLDTNNQDLLTNNWLVELSQTLTNSYQNSELQTKKSYSRSPFFADYILKECSQKYLARIKNLLKKQGVEYIDIYPQNKQINLDYKELQKNYKHLIWALSGPETKQCFPNNMSLLFPNWQKPVKIWQRFSISWDQKNFNQIIPYLLLIIPDDIKNNIISLKKHPSSSWVDLWILCPYEDKFNKDILNTHLQSAIQQLKLFFPGFLITGEVPKEPSHQNYFIVYGHKNTFNKKVFYLNPESAQKIDAYSIMQKSQQIGKNIFNLHSRRDLKIHVK